MCYVPEGSSQDGLLTVGPIEGEESGGDDRLSIIRGLLEANFIVAAVHAEESDVYHYNTPPPPIKRVCVHACVRTCVHACLRACVHTCVRAYVSACMHAYVRVCVRTCVCVYMWCEHHYPCFPSFCQTWSLLKVLTLSRWPHS